MPASQIKQPVLRVVGAMHIDEVATVQGRFVPQASNPVNWQSFVGGVGCNAARAAQALFTSKAAERTVSFHTALGDDSAGQALMDNLQADGLRVHPQYIRECSTGRYSLVIDESGQLLIGLADVQLAERLQAGQLLSTINPEMTTSLLLDANLSPQCIQILVEAACNSSVSIAALTVSPSKAVRLLPWASKIDLMFCNRREAQALAIGSNRVTDTPDAEKLTLQALADILVELGFNDFVLTDAASALLIRYREMFTRVQIPPVTIKHNVNGAGDALAGASVAALMLGLPLEQAVTEYGLDMAADVLGGRRLPLTL